jgi:prephenate dehydrogenase
VRSQESAALEVVVVGLGLVGGSLARALTASGHRVLGIDRDKVRRAARRAGAVAATAAAIEEVRQADVVVLAAPPAANRALLRRLARAERPRFAITDVGSVKGPIVGDATRLGLESFVGGHPMAGTERRGFAASRLDLFQGATWWLVPASDPQAARVVRRLVRDVGGRPRSIGAEEHDRVVAFLSHAPQLAAWALFEAARADPVVRRHLAGAGPGFRDMTRLARSPRRLWREILRENETEVRRAVADLGRRLAVEARRSRGSTGRSPASPRGGRGG